MPTDPKIDNLHHQLFEEGLKVRREDPLATSTWTGLDTTPTPPPDPDRGSLASGPGPTSGGDLASIGSRVVFRKPPNSAMHTRSAINNDVEIEIKEAEPQATVW